MRPRSLAGLVVLAFAVALLLAVPAAAEEVRFGLGSFGSVAQPSFVGAKAVAVDQSSGDVYVVDGRPEVQEKRDCRELADDLVSRVCRDSNEQFRGLLELLASYPDEARLIGSRSTSLNRWARRRLAARSASAGSW